MAISRMSPRFRVFLAAALVAGLARPAAAQQPTLGPRDGAGLPPADTARVAIGSPAPDWTLRARDGSLVTLSSFRGRKHVILVFYRGHW